MKKKAHRRHRHQVQNPLNQKNQVHQAAVRMIVAHQQNQVMNNNLKVQDNFLGF